MFSVTYTGTNFLPLCTAIVCPIMSGCTVERRDHVRTTFLSFAWFSVVIFTIRCTSTNAPFFVDLAISDPLRFPLELVTRYPLQLRLTAPSSQLPFYFLPRETINASVRLLFLVLYPRVG